MRVGWGEDQQEGEASSSEVGFAPGTLWWIRPLPPLIITMSAPPPTTNDRRHHHQPYGRSDNRAIYRQPTHPPTHQPTNPNTGTTSSNWVGRGL